MDNIEGEYISVVAAAFRSLLKSHGSDRKFTNEQIVNVAHDFKILEREWFTDYMEKMLIKDLSFLVDYHWEILTDRRNIKEVDFNIRGILR